MVDPRRPTTGVGSGHARGRTRRAARPAGPGVTSELLRALAVMAERPGPDTARVAAALGLEPPDEVSWTRLFVFDVYPAASVYLGPEGQVGGVAGDRIAGFFRALAAEPPPEPDALPTLLAAWSQLRERAETGDDRARRAEATLVHEHLRSWMPLVLDRIRDRGPRPWASWATLVGSILHRTPPRGLDVLPLHLRAAPSFLDPRDSGETLVDQLLVPVRCGFLVTTSDLRRAARDTGLPLRLAERRYVLRQLLGQSVPTTLRWVADHGVTSTTAAWDGWDDVAGDAAAWWRTRASATARLLRTLADEADEATVEVPGGGRDR